MTRTACTLALFTSLLACGAELEEDPATDETAARRTSSAGTQHTLDDAAFHDVAHAAGVHFEHEHGGRGRKFLFETMGSGVAVDDFDGDGLPEIFLLQSGTLPVEAFSADELSSARHTSFESSRLFANRGGLRFDDVTSTSGLGEPHFAMGVAAGDIDADGDRDLYVAAYGPDRLHRNDGDLVFSEVSALAGVVDPRWTVGGAFFDADLDGDLDLYSVAYLDMPISSHTFCGPSPEQRIYCHVDRWPGIHDRLWLNDGSGFFTDGSAHAGLTELAGKGLAAVTSDFDLDGDVDVFVANDGMANHLLINASDGGAPRFVEQARRAGLDLNADGRTEACMGVALGDFDADGDSDLYVANFELETNTLYRNEGRGFFTDISVASGAGAPTRAQLGFGALSLDADNDGDLDLYVTNGHILDNAEDLEAHRRWAQPDQLFLNAGDGRFTHAPESTGASLTEARVGRGLARGDLDGDGDDDLVVNNNSGAPWVLENRFARGHSLQLELLGPHGRADAEGARVSFEFADRELVREFSRGESYASHSTSVIQLGLAASESVRVRVRWPGGAVSEHGPWTTGARYRIGFEGASEERRALPPAPR
ncbi:MAG: RNA-binding protein [Planctomycetota bacterium]|nr:MAG: RNA-binding protein [Planctomycetota bacterium]